MSTMERIIVLLTILHFVHPTILCGDEICHGGEAYCCSDADDDTPACCWNNVYNPFYLMWWFWLIIIFFALGLIIACQRCWVLICRVFGFDLEMFCANTTCECDWEADRAREPRPPTYGSVSNTQPRTSRGPSSRGTAPAPVPSGSTTPPPEGYPRRPPCYEAVRPLVLPSYSDSEEAKNATPPEYCV